MGFIYKIKNALVSFFKTVVFSIYSPEFYKTLPGRKTSSALGYYFFLIFILSLLTSIPLIWTFVSGGQNFMNEMTAEAEGLYPEELVIIIQDGEATTNVQEPYFIQFPSDEDETDTNLLVIDTATPFSTDQFDEYNTIAWLTKDALFLQQESGQFRTFDLSEIPNTTIDRQAVQSLIAKVTPWLKLVIPVLAVMIIFGLYLFHMMRLIYFFFLALLIWITSKIIKKNLTYSQSYKVTLHAATLGIILELLLSLLEAPGFPFMVTLITIGVYVVNSLGDKTPAQQEKDTQVIQGPNK